MGHNQVFLAHGNRICFSRSMIGKTCDTVLAQGVIGVGWSRPGRACGR